MISEKEILINKNELKFPEGFLWGTSTSAYQIEGGNKNDWSEWEESPGRIKKLQHEKKDPKDYICGTAVDFFNRYEEDLNLALALNGNAIRLSIEWSRIEPKKDTYDVEAIKYYRNLFTAAKEKGFITVITLWHWTNPIWFRDEGGWLGKGAEQYFLKYVDLVLKEFGGLIDYWVVYNEPTLHIANGYLRGKWPPNRKGLLEPIKVYRTLTRTYINSYKLIHKHFPGARVSISAITNFVEPAGGWNPVEVLFAKIYNYICNAWFLNKIKNHIDYVGCHYYFHDRIVWYPPFKRNKNKKVTDMRWEIYPVGIYHVLKFLSRYGKPIFILENGLADEKDKYRAEFIRDHLKYVHQAISEGVNVIGYLHWSLLDNFEWSDGWSPKFGLYAVDRTTLARTPRPSAGVYAEICRKNSL